MIIRRDTAVIGNVGNYTEEKSRELTTALDKLIKDINSITESYKGEDANIETANKVNTIIRNFENYGKYMKNVSDHDNENINRTKKQLNIQNDKPTPMDEEAAFQTLSLGVINGYNVGNVGDING